MKKILLAEDEKDLVEVVKLRLEANNYEVIAAYDGEEALSKAHKLMPDLIILDLMLPKMDGYKVRGLLKKNARYANIPIIMFTARGQKNDEELGREMGADAYIIKPFEPQALLSKIQELLK